MKKILFIMLALCCAMTVSAQEKLETYSVYDVNHDTKIAVGDVTAVVDRAKQTIADDKQVVDADALNALLMHIEARLAAIEAKLGITTPADPYNGHEYVDLGLSVKWATCNVGADKPEDYGGYYAWGETETKSTYSWSTYRWCSNENWTGMTKYTIPDGRVSGVWYSNNTFIGDNKCTLDLEDDVAHVKWGGGWRMPTKAEMDELCDENNCTWTSTTQGDKSGYLVTSKKNGNSIFLPAAGDYNGSWLNDEGFCGNYWSCSLSNVLSHEGGNIEFIPSDFIHSVSNRYLGYSVRPVCP